LSNPAIEQKLAQLYAALAEMKVTDKLASMKPTITVVGGRNVTSWDFTKIEAPATAANRVSLLLHNIACLKDHLHTWCVKNNKPKTGDQLIDSNRDVAIIHDLWNLGQTRRAESAFQIRTGASLAATRAHDVGEKNYDNRRDVDFCSFNLERWSIAPC
jgi:hypothetical protein